MPTSIPLAQHIPTLIFLLVTVLTAALINRTQPTPYIDEIFHVPQAQRFCSALAHASPSQIWAQLGSVEYDNKLTTPPGVYLVSVALAKVLPGWRCSDVVWLRSTNLVLLLTLPVLIARIIGKNEQPPSYASSASNAVRIPEQRRPVSRQHIRALQDRAKHDRAPAPAPPSAPPSVVQRSQGNAALPVRLKRREASVYTMGVACTISMLPPLWFFGFLYYTDVASVWLVLACIVLYDRLTAAPSLHSLALAGTASLLAVLVRQTNLVWVGFAAGQATLAATQSASTSSGLVVEMRDVVLLAFGRVRGSSRFWTTVAWNGVAMMPMLAGAAWFVCWNGSIVLGDKANHQAGTHLAQIGYFLLFATAFGLPALVLSLGSPAQSHAGAGSVLTPVRGAVRAVGVRMFGTLWRTLCTLLIAVLFWAAAAYYTIEHPFLLADNRHYTFYLWRLFQRPLLRMQPRFALVPLYVFTLYAWAQALVRRTSVLRAILLGCATAATLVPTPLVEPRYFAVPYVLLRVYSQPVEREGRVKWVYLAAEAGVLAAVNLATVGLFVGRPFEWAPTAVDQARNEATTMRFIW